MLTIFASKLCARKFCLPITLQPSIAIATCRKTCFLQIVLLQGKVKPYLGLQNLGCHCKILGCHFDTQKRYKKLWASDCKLEHRLTLRQQLVEEAKRYSADVAVMSSTKCSDSKTVELDDGWKRVYNEVGTQSWIISYSKQLWRHLLLGYADGNDSVWR